MKKKTVLLALLMLTALPLFSQEDTVKLPFSIAKKIALDLEELDRLQAVQKVNVLEISKYKNLTISLREISSNKSLQIELLQNSNNSLETQLKAEKAKKPENNLFTKILIWLGVFSAGYLMGSL